MTKTVNEWIQEKNKPIKDIGFSIDAMALKVGWKHFKDSYQCYFPNEMFPTLELWISSRTYQIYRKKAGFSRIQKKKYKNVYQIKIILDLETSIWRRILVPETYTFYDLHVAIQNAMGWNDEHLNHFILKNPLNGKKVMIADYEPDNEVNFEEEIKDKVELQRKRSELVKKLNDIEIVDKENFSSINKNIGSLDGMIEMMDVIILSNAMIPSSTQKIAYYFTLKNRVAYYEYDMGDSWGHTIFLEEIIPRIIDVDYPQCIEGERACPFENSGGYHDYLQYVEILKDPKHPEHKEVLEWLNFLEPPHWIGRLEQFDSEYFNPKKIEFEDPVKHKRIIESRD